MSKMVFMMESYIKYLVLNELPSGVFLELQVAKVLGHQIVVPLDAHLVVIVDVNGLARITQLDASETLGEVASGNCELAC